MLRTPIDHEFILGTTPSSARHEQVRERQHHGEGPGERSVAGQEATTTYAHVRRYAVPAGLDGRALEACLPPAPTTTPTAMRGTVKVG